MRKFEPDTGTIHLLSSTINNDGREVKEKVSNVWVSFEMVLKENIVHTGDDRSVELLVVGRTRVILCWEGS